MSILGVRIPAVGFGIALAAALAIRDETAAARLVDCPPGTSYVEAPIGNERATWCARKDGRREGPWILWYDAKRKKEQGAFRAGEREGLWRTWYPDGKAQSEGTQSAGVRTGTWKTWHSNGQLEQLSSFTNGALDGPWTTWYRNGNKSEEGRMERGLKAGTWTTFYDTGKKASEGAFKPYASTWVEGARGRYVAGPIDSTREDGRWTYWYPNGEKRREGSYRVGCQDGGWAEWDEKGRASLTIWKDCERVEP